MIIFNNVYGIDMVVACPKLTILRSPIVTTQKNDTNFMKVVPFSIVTTQKNDMIFMKVVPFSIVTTQENLCEPQLGKIESGF